MATTRVTVTLPEELLAEVDLQTGNRSLFVTEALRAELDRRRNLRLAEALQHPHPESAEMADCGFQEWVELASGDDLGLIDPETYRPVCWDPTSGWRELP